MRPVNPPFVTPMMENLFEFRLADGSNPMVAFCVRENIGDTSVLRMTTRWRPDQSSAEILYAGGDVMVTLLIGERGVPAMAVWANHPYDDPERLPESIQKQIGYVSQTRRRPDGEGHYWASWIAKSPGTSDPNEPPDGRWEVVQVFRRLNYEEGDTEGQFRVFVPGVERSQSLENFVWGQRIEGGR